MRMRNTTYTASFRRTEYLESSAGHLIKMCTEITRKGEEYDIVEAKSSNDHPRVWRITCNGEFFVIKCGTKTQIVAFCKKVHHLLAC